MRTAYSARQDLLILKVLNVPFPVEQYVNNMFTMNDTKQIFCVSEVLVHTIAVVQITYMLLESFCNLGYRFIQVPFVYSILVCIVSNDVKMLFIQIKYCLHY